MANEAFQLPLLTLVFLYMLHTTGELFLSPIGLSMVTKLSPKSMTATAMGGWFLSFAFANYVAAFIAKMTGGGGHGEGGDAAAASAADNLAQYVDVYSMMGFVTVGIGIFVCLPVANAEQAYARCKINRTFIYKKGASIPLAPFFIYIC